MNEELKILIEKWEFLIQKDVPHSALNENPKFLVKAFISDLKEIQQKKFIVTLKFRQEGHNAREKKEGICLASRHCTDSTGHHHSILIEGSTRDVVIEKIKRNFDLHITRIEEVHEVY